MKITGKSIKCRNCGNEIPATSVFCMHCGAQIHRKRSTDDKKEVSVPEPKQVASGKWQIRLMVEGKNYFILKDSYAECKAEAIAIKTGIKTAEKKKRKITLKTLLDKYIEDNMSVLSPSTIRCYDSMSKHHFQDIIHQNIEDIRWQAAINRESASFKPKTVINCWRLATAAMNAYDYPVPKVNLPKKVSRTAKFLDYEQIQVFLKAIRGKNSEIAYLLALHSMRISEILALNQTSLDNGTIHVRGAVVPNKENKYVFKETNKNATSTRDIPVMIPRLSEIWPKEGQELKFESHTQIFRELKTICRENNLPEISIHCLRHSFASLAYHLNWSMLTTCKVGGWSTPDCVQKIYTHLSTLDENADVIRMKEYYGIKTEKKNAVTKEKETENGMQILCAPEIAYIASVRETAFA